MPNVTSTTRRSARRRTTTNRRPSKGLRATIKKTVLGLAETKSYHFDVSHDCYDNLTHWVTSNALTLPVQGVGAHQRIGTSVQSKGIMLRGMINLDSTNVTLTKCTSFGFLRTVQCSITLQQVITTTIKLV